jgi:signal transduction histidine kinase
LQRELQASRQFSQSSLDALSAHIAILDGNGTILAVNASWRQFAAQNRLEWEDYGVGRSYLGVTESASGDLSQGAREAATGIREVIAGQRDEFRLEYPCHSPEEERWFVLRATRFESAQGVRVVTSHEEITERVQAEEALRERVVELSTLHSIAGMLATITDLTQAIQAVAEIMTSLFDASVTLVTLLDAEGGELQIVAGFARSSGGFSRTAQAFPLHEMPITRRVLEQGQITVLPDVQALPLAAPVRAYVSDLDLHAFMLVPLKARGRVIGILALGTDQTDHAFTPVDVALAETIAGDVAAAVENVRLAEQARAAAVGTERGRLARELHDSVTQALYSITLHTDATLLALSAGKTDVVEERLKRLNKHAREAMTEMRMLIHELRPSILEEAGLAEALKVRLESVEARSGLKANLQVVGQQRRLPATVEDALYRVALEGLNNVLKHAQAREVELDLGFDEGAVRLTIKDDGIGFDLDSAARYGGYGLAMMQERVEHIGGSLSIETAPGAGTTLRVEVET